MATSKELEQRIREVYQALDSGVDRGQIDRMIQDHIKDVDRYVYDKSREFQQNKDEYLVDYENAYTLMDYGGYKPLWAGLNNERRLPVSPEAVPAFSVQRTHEALENYWSELASLDSKEAFEAYREDLEAQYDQIDETVSYQDITDSLSVSGANMDDVSVKRLHRLGLHIQHDQEREVLDVMDDFQRFATSGDPMLREVDDIHAYYLQTLKTKDYMEDLKQHEVDNMFDYSIALNDDYRRSGIIRTKNYEQLLFGLYDQDKQAVEMSGMKDEFQEAVDTYFLETGYDMMDLHMQDGTGMGPVDGTRYADLLTSVSKNLGFTDAEADRFLSLMEYEDTMFIESGVKYAARGGTEQGEKGFAEDRHRWLMDGFHAVYDQPIDYNADYKRYLDNLRREDITQEQLNQMEVDMQMDTKEPTPEGGLFDVSLSKRMSPDYGLTKEAVSSLEQVGLLISQIHLQEDDANEQVKRVFEQELNRTASEWGYSENTYIEDPELFVDMLAHTTNRSLNALEKADPAGNPNVAHTEGHTVVAQALGHNIESTKVKDFTDGYRLMYDAPIDASLMTMNEVHQTMNRPQFAGVIGEVNYHDVFKSATSEDVNRLIQEKQREIQGEVLQEVEEAVKPYAESKGASWDDAIEDDGPEL